MRLFDGRFDYPHDTDLGSSGIPSHGRARALSYVRFDYPHGGYATLPAFETFIILTALKRPNMSSRIKIRI